MAIQQNGSRILRAFFMETGTTPDMTARSFTTSVSPTDVNMLDQITHGGSLTNATALAQVAGNVILPDMNSGRAINVPNGLGTKRLRFLLEFGNPHPSASGSRIYINGYTDFAGFSVGQNDLAPDMKIYFNGATEIVQSQQYVNGNVVPHVSVINSDHILHPASMSGIVGGFNPQMSFNPSGVVVPDAPSFIRPVDLMCVNQSALDNTGTTIPLIDTRTGIQTAMSSRNNNVPAYYLEKTMNAMSKAMFDMSNSTGYVGENKYMYAASNAIETAMSNNRLLDRLATDFDYLTNGFVTWRSLCEACPELHEYGVAKFFTNQQIAAQRTNSDYLLADRTNYDSMANNATMHTQLITQVLQSVPALLLRHLITECVMTVTNRTVDGKVSVTIQNPFTLTTLPQGYMAQRIPFIAQTLESIIFSNMGANAYAQFFMRLRINCFGETIVELDYNGQQFNTAVPSYCDAVHSMIISPTRQNLLAMANDVNYISDCITNSGGVITDDFVQQPSYAAPQQQPVQPAYNTGTTTTSGQYF